MNLDDSHLSERDDSLDGIRHQVLAHLGLLLNPHPRQCVRTPRLCVLQEVTRCRETGQTMNKGQRPAGKCGTIQSAMRS